MTKQTIEVEVPEGWKVKEYRMPNKGDYFWHQNRVCVASSSFIDQRLIIEKIQPRRIVLEKTGRKIDFSYTQNFKFGDELISVTSSSVLREVKETDIPLTNEDVNVKIGVSQRDGAEPKLSLSVDECKEAMRKLETFNVTDLSVKICGFLKENS